MGGHCSNCGETGGCDCFKVNNREAIERVGANGQPVELLEIGGRVVEVDAEIAPLVRALNAAGLETVASCSGHGHRPADIALRDGREIIVARDFAEARRINALFPTDINGNALSALSDMGVSEEASLFALNLKSVAKRERNIGNQELSGLLDAAALMIDRLAMQAARLTGLDK